MIRAKVTAVDANGVYVLTADYGTIGPCQVVGPTPAVDDMVLAANVGTDVAPDLVVLSGGFPATSTDNTVPRFDGAGGALQTSGVRVDDGNNIVTKGTFVSGNGATGSNHITVDAPKDTANADLGFRANGVNRWTIRRTADTESGSNAGSDLALVRRSDAGAQLSLPIIVWRATGKITVGDVGPTAGIELGAGGPTITTGTGAPTHSAPNGSTYHRQDGTASTTLYVRAAGAWSALS